jgi:hypothetical protein
MTVSSGNESKSKSEDKAESKTSNDNTNGIQHLSAGDDFSMDELPNEDPIQHDDSFNGSNEHMRKCNSMI